MPRNALIASLIGVILLAGSVLATPADAANHGAGFGHTCRVFPLKPPAPTLNSSLRKDTQSVVRFGCPPVSSDTGSQPKGVFIPQTVEIQWELRGDDPIRDDVLQRVQSTVRTVDGTFLLNVVPTPIPALVRTSRVTCIEEQPGRDELS